jgi:transposase
MTVYQNFIGIDIGKFTFVAANHGNKVTHEYEYDSKGIALFLKDFKDLLPSSLVVLETTGGYEMELLLNLIDKKFSVHRANTRKVKSFIRSFGNMAKTDALDAKALALYGSERYEHLELFVSLPKDQLALYELVQRRKDLKQILVAEKNRIKAPKVALIKDSCKAIIKTIEEQIKCITDQIKEIILSDRSLQQRKDILKTIPGIGDIVAQELLALMPELGMMTRRQVASLAGVAPRANDSGKSQGYRRTAHGRDAIKPILFLSAMAARNSNSVLKEFYQNLIGRGKRKMVALTALMRKIIVIANARLAEWYKKQPAIA